MDWRRRAGHAVDRRLAVVADMATGRFDARFDELFGVYIINADGGVVGLGGHKPGFEREWPNARQHVSAVGRHIDPAFAHVHLRKEIIDVGSRNLGGADDRDLAGQWVATTDAVDLKLVARTHDLEENLVALRGIGRKIRGQKKGAA